MKKRITISVCFGSNDDHKTHPLQSHFDIRKNILFSQHLLRKHRRFLCPSNTK